MTRDFFRYYWLEVPEHTYDVTAVEGYEASLSEFKPTSILSLDHFKWGLYRLYIDGLLYFGNVRTAFWHFRTMRSDELHSFFRSRRIDTEALTDRGPLLPLKPIPRGHRYLVSEMVTSSFGADPRTNSELKRALLEAWRLHLASRGGRTSVCDLLNDDDVKAAFGHRHERTLLSATDFLDELVESEHEIHNAYDRATGLYEKVTTSALRNSELYLSLVNSWMSTLQRV